MAITVTGHRLHQAHAHLDLPDAAPRRQGPHRHAHARRGLRQPPLHRLDARLHHDFLGSRPRLLAARSTRFPTSVLAARARRSPISCRWRKARRLRRCWRSRSGRPKRASSSSSWGRARASSRRPTSRLQQPARRRHHRDGRRGRGLGHRRRAVGRQRADLPRHARRHGDPLRGDRRPPDGPRPRTASAASPCATATRSSRWTSCARAARC